MEHEFGSTEWDIAMMARYTPELLIELLEVITSPATTIVTADAPRYKRAVVL